MLSLFENLTMALYNNLFLALGASLVYGILSILISPCHLAAIPIVIAFINDQKSIDTRKALGISSMFALGILITLLIVGIITSISGLILGNADKVMRIFISVLLLLVGLYFLDLIQLPDLGGISDKRIKNRPYISGLILGIFFGIALGPCAFAFMAPILGIVIQEISTRPFFSIGLMAMFLLGHCGIIIVAGTFTEVVKRYLAWDGATKGTFILRKICGVLIIIGAIYTFCKALHLF